MPCWFPDNAAKTILTCLFCLLLRSSIVFDRSPRDKPKPRHPNIFLWLKRHHRLFKFNSKRKWYKRIPWASATGRILRAELWIQFLSIERVIQCMEEIQSTSKQPATIILAGTLARIMKDNKYIFWLSFFHKLMPHVNILYNQLELNYTLMPWGLKPMLTTLSWLLIKRGLTWTKGLRL